jgi:hypothetical protein
MMTFARAWWPSRVPRDRQNPDLAKNFVRQLPVAECAYFAEHVEQHITKSARGGVSEHANVAMNSGDAHVPGVFRVVQCAPPSTVRCSPPRTVA